MLLLHGPLVEKKAVALQRCGSGRQRRRFDGKVSSAGVSLMMMLMMMKPHHINRIICGGRPATYSTNNFVENVN